MMQILDFKIDRGYLYLYSRRHYHPQYIRDGELLCQHGEILESDRLEYPPAWYMPGCCPTETKPDEPKWESRTERKALLVTIRDHNVTAGKISLSTQKHSAKGGFT